MHCDHEPQTPVRPRASVLECASPLALSDPSASFAVHARTSTVWGAFATGRALRGQGRGGHTNSPPNPFRFERNLGQVEAVKLIDDMDQQLNFRFSIPRAPAGPLVELSLQEAEKLLLKELESAKADPTAALWKLAQFYKLSKQHEKALECLRRLMQRLPDPEQKAECVLTMGQAMEQVGDFPAAVRYYKEALALEPTHTFTWYFINNNLGFCLNTLGQFSEGEVYCRKALGIDRRRPNAYKNLGISLAGQSQFQEAARCFVAATQANAADPRAFGLLQELISQHPELEFEFQEALTCCRQAVDLVAKKAAEIKPVVHRGWRKDLILLWARVRSCFRRSSRPKPASRTNS